MNDLPTSCVEFISTIHGRQRRCEREISVRDLQSAVRYGVKELQIGQGKGIGKFPFNYDGVRYKFTYNNIVYIVDETCTREVTSYALNQLPLEKAVIDESLARQNFEQKRRILSGASATTSHTVIVVDQSASMNKGDIMGHRSRSRGAYYTIASEMIAQPLLRYLTSFTDVVSIIEMRDDAVLNHNIYMEPITWELHNKIVDLAEVPLSGKGHGNYLPALVKAYEILNQTDNQSCALLLLFVSDGKPSDAMTSYRYVSNSHSIVRDHIIETLQKICMKFGERLTFGAFGFAQDNGDTFALLKEMTSMANQSGSKGIFSSGLDTQTLRKALFTMSTSLSTTRSNLSSLAGGSLLFRTTKNRRTDLIKDTSDGSDIIFDKTDYDFLYKADNLKRWSYKKNWKDILVLNKGKINSNQFFTTSFSHPMACGIAIKKRFLGEGAERFAFEMTEVGETGNPVGAPFIAKLSAHLDVTNQFEFHKQCAITQLEAMRLAKVFNKVLDEKNLKIPKIEFLEICFYTWGDGDFMGVLAEKRLDNNRYRKFNDNKGGVHNINKRLELDDEKHMIDYDTVEITNNPYSNLQLIANISDEIDKIIDEDVPQAFSHWTFQYTYGDSLVCDLQGVLGRSAFSFTDPAINSKKRGKFGRTDQGRYGQSMFFKSHNCGSLCKVLGLHMRVKA